MALSGSLELFLDESLYASWRRWCCDFVDSAPLRNCEVVYQGVSSSCGRRRA